MKKQDYQLIAFGQNNPEFEYSDFERLLRIKRLAKKHLRQCENSCNGYGYVKGKMYYSGLSYGKKAGDYEIREYGYGVQSAYLTADCEENIFDVEISKIQESIDKLQTSLLKVKYQHDPRGATVKVFWGEDNITHLIY